MVDGALEAFTEEELLAELEQIAARLAEVEPERDGLYARRLAVFLEARRREPPVTQRVLAERAGVSEVAVIAAIRSDRERRAKAATG